MRLLAGEPLPPLPSVSDLLDAGTPRRPGELHEALPLSNRAAQVVATEAATLGIGDDVAASLLVEAGLAVADAGPEALQLRGAAGCQDSALSESSARYVRALTIARRPGRAVLRPAATAAIPVRLVTRLADKEIDELIATVELEVAVSWEVAAMLEGRTMAEWVLLRVNRNAD
jgi:hypothetical protein